MQQVSVYYVMGCFILMKIAFQVIFPKIESRQSLRHLGKYNENKDFLMQINQLESGNDNCQSI